MTNWQRPESIPFPKLWASFEGKREVNGVKKKYWIQDLTQEYYDEVLDHMSTGFVMETPIYQYSNFIEDPQSVKDYIAAWRKMMDQKLTLICLSTNENGEEQLVGCNILGTRHKHEHRDLNKIFKGKASRTTGGALFYAYNLIDVFLELNVDMYMSAFGLYVLPDFRGDAVGYEILKARREIGLAVGLEVSVTAFTSVGGQALAEKVGFKDIIEIPMENFEKVNPMFKFPGIENSDTKTIKVMFIKYK